MIGRIQDSRAPAGSGLGVDGNRDAAAEGVLQELVGIVLEGDVAAVEGDQVIAFLDVHAGFRERRAQGLVPAFAGIDLLDDIAAGLGVGGQLGAQEPALDPGGPGDVAPFDVGVADVELADQLAEDEVQVGPVPEVGHEAAVFFLHPGPVDAVQVADVEPVPVDADGVVEDLGPLQARLDLHGHVGKAQGPVAGLLAGLQVDDAEALAVPVEDLLAVGRDGQPGMRPASTGDSFLSLRENWKIPPSRK